MNDFNYQVLKMISMPVITAYGYTTEMSKIGLAIRLKNKIKIHETKNYRTPTPKFANHPKFAKQVSRFSPENLRKRFSVRIKKHLATPHGLAIAGNFDSMNPLRVGESVF